MTLLEVSNLDVEYQTKEGPIKAVDDVSFAIDEGQRFGLVGESGCGKSTIAKSLLQLLPKNGRVTGGSIEFKGRELTSIDDKTLREIRWEEMSFISQSAMNALDPVYSVGDQIVEAILTHRDVPKADAKEQAADLLEDVGLERKRVNSYPHELSGGMRQRAMIAMALALDPALIIADEPTTALDVITQDHIIEQINRLLETIGSSLFIITHDISVVAETCDHVGVMYGGKLVETGPIEEVFVEPEHPYTLGLLNAFPKIEGGKDELITMPGQPPDLRDPPTGCRFYDRCPYREEKCSQTVPPLSVRGKNQRAACFVSEEQNITDEYEKIINTEEQWLKL